MKKNLLYMGEDFRPSSQSIDMEEIDLEGHLPPMQEVREIDPLTSVMGSMRKPASMMDPESASVIASAVAAGLPALSATLNNSSPQIQNRQFQYADNYAKSRGDARVPSKENLMELVDDQSNPYYDIAENAQGKTPYHKPLGIGSMGGAGKQFAPIAVRNLRTGEVLPARVTGEGFADVDTGDVFNRDWVPYRKDELIRERTAPGGSIVKARNPFNGQVSQVSSQAGLGDYYGSVPKEQAQSGIKSSEKARTASQKAVEAVQGAQRSLDILSSNNLTPEKASAGIFNIIKAINGERLSDSDYANLRGQEFKSYARQVEDWAGGRIAGRISPKAIEAYKQIAIDMINDKNGEIAAIKSLYVPKGMLPKQGQRKVEKSAGMEDSESNWKNKLKGMK